MTDYLVVSRTAPMAARPADIAAHIVDFRRWIDWSPWEGLDPDLKREYRGADSGVGAVYEWSGNSRAGAGSMTITQVSDDEIAMDLDFTRPFRSASKTRFRFSGGAAQGSSDTQVTWEVHTPQSLMTRVVGLFVKFDKTIGADLEKGLSSLSRVVAQAG